MSLCKCAEKRNEATTVDVRRFTERTLIPRYANSGMLSGSYQYAVMLCGLENINRNYSLEYRASDDDRPWAMAMAEMLKSRHESVTNISPHVLMTHLCDWLNKHTTSHEYFVQVQKLYGALMESNITESSIWNTENYREIIADGDKPLILRKIIIEDHIWDALSEIGVNVRSGGIRIPCRVWKDTGNHSLTSDHQGNLIVTFDGCKNPDYNLLFAMEIAKCFMDSLTKRRSDTLYTFDTEAAIDDQDEKVRFWYANVFGKK